jgi:nucleotide-binding universal stress UspA family protein
VGGHNLSGLPGLFLVRRRLVLEKILVPLDGSGAAEAVLPEVRGIFASKQPDLILVRAANPIVMDAYPGVLEVALAEARKYVLDKQEELARLGVTARGLARLGPPFRVVLDIAREERAGLIALATHGRTGFRRAVLGSVAEQILRESPIPVLVFRSTGVPAPERSRRTLRSILVPLDGSDRALFILPAGVEFARLFGARLLLLRVVDRGESRTSAEDQLGEVAEKLRHRGLDVLPLVDTGDAAKSIVETARFHNADLIAMATHGRSGVARLVTGSVTEAVLRHATVPVLAVRSLETARERHVA